MSKFLPFFFSSWWSLKNVLIAAKAEAEAEAEMQFASISFSTLAQKCEFPPPT